MGCVGSTGAKVRISCIDATHGANWCSAYSSMVGMRESSGPEQASTLT